MKKYKHPTLNLVAEKDNTVEDCYAFTLSWRNNVCWLKELLALWFVEVEEKKLPMSWEELNAEVGYWIDMKTWSAELWEYQNEYPSRVLRPTKELARASLAMSQLMQLRDVWREWWKPNRLFSCGRSVSVFDELDSELYFESISFETSEKRDLFQKTFGDLIETARPLFYS